MLDKFWDFLVDTALYFFIPLVCSYLALTANVFLNTSCHEARGLEKWGNYLLIPCQYLLVGQVAKQNERGEWVFTNRFDYMNGHFGVKTVASSLAALPSLALGATVKGLSLLTQGGGNHHQSLSAAKKSTQVHLKDKLYQSYGVDLRNGLEKFISQRHPRRPGDENNMAAEKEGLRDIAAALNEAKLTWWVDCGTCLGTYRHGGAIPYDQDIDVAVFLEDFENVRRALNRLDPKKYIVQDWSSRERPQSYLKVYIRKSRTLIDIYHFKILPETKQIQYLLSLENHIFFPKWWVIREKRFTVPVAFDIVFPLKKALFDGIEVNVPNDIEAYLRRYYGQNLAPARIYDSMTGKYEKDLTHPYWQQAYVH